MKTKISILTIAALLIGSITIFNNSCKKDDVNLIATSIELVSGNNQTGLIETALANPIEVIIKDQNGNAFKGATVYFTIVEGSVSSAATITGANGKASVNWTLSSTVGTQTLIVTAFKKDGTTALTASPISVNATAMVEATSIELVLGADQTGSIESALANPIEVIIKDQNGDAFQGATVNFVVAEGSVSSTVATTDENGEASVTWTLGSTLGTQVLSVTAFKSDGTTALNGSPITVNTTAIQKMPTEGLVAYYPFNGNANDESGNGNNGTINGAASSTDGIIDNCLLFSSNSDYVLTGVNLSTTLGKSN